MTELGPIRTALFVPGNRPDRVDKAVNSGADAVIIDLEDAVALGEKEKVRPMVREKILEHVDRKIIVRVNAMDSQFFQGDLNEVIVPGLGCIIVPKVEQVDHIREINRHLLHTEREKGLAPGTISIIPLIESAKAMQNIFQIVSEKTDPIRLLTVAFGSADYTLDMGIEMTKEGAELLYPRSRISIACRAADVEPPLDTPFMVDLKDMEALKADAKIAKQLGFQGKLCVHPNQIEPCNAIFSPTREEILYAEKVVQAFDEAEAKGIAVFQLDGKFVDYAVVERSRRVLKLAVGIPKPGGDL
ncbi:MAG: CoA ester lyase [Deltaproteobacteria bacterium]|nr:CoA ester lyase [Deltaproteobacteria bacterium]